MSRPDSELKNASRNYRFGLIPTITSELKTSTVLELMAGDAEAYREWVSVLRAVTGAYRHLEALPSISETIRTGHTGVEGIISAANQPS